MSTDYNRSLTYLRRGRIENPSRPRTHVEHLADDCELIRARWCDTPPVVAERNGTVIRIVCRDEREAEKVIFGIRKLENDLGTLLVAIGILCELKFDSKQIPEADGDLAGLIRAAWGNLDPGPHSGRPRKQKVASGDA